MHTLTADIHEDTDWKDVRLLDKPQNVPENKFPNETQPRTPRPRKTLHPHPDTTATNRPR
ncbi:hypothetical protein FD724_32655 (plasmid) [Nostoc sp. C057]|uniref:hypothetical protein n=1 Tax=Nostoc sp. C057 TaxID=2576903 RepID=UPI0015C3DAE4|nr:hypothetical protein [Nostoc sp. C057]QLE52718.1 hypothetical protein FD724_32655 [Nostoc sp. C057]